MPTLEIAAVKGRILLDPALFSVSSPALDIGRLYS